ncbi:MAG: thiolase family protein [Nocardioidaceae bacterium]|nr:thiolase family protein [Nocardioidaceae bacterium]
MPTYLLDAVRTPFGKARGGLSHVRIDDLGAIPMRRLLARHAGLEHEVDDVFFGNVNGAGEDNRNVARMSLLLAGLPVQTPGTSVNRLCGSGAEAVVQGSRAIASGDGHLVVVGGVEGMSRAPFVVAPVDEALPRSLEFHQTTVGWRMVNPLFPGHWVESLGRSAEIVAEEYGITREEQDEWALRSQERAGAAWRAGLHDDVEPVEGVTMDECIRPDSSAQALARLSPVFSSTGTVTAGTSSPISDGSIAALLGSGSAAKRAGIEPMAEIVGSAVVGVDPARFATAPVAAVAKLLKRLGRSPSDVAVLEINEAFAAVVLTCLRDMDGFPPDVVNPHGGAIAMGHPLGASAARVVVDCARELRRRGGGFGIATACIGVGQGIAIGIEA